jgi:amino acid adenylation domain-containing protein
MNVLEISKRLVELGVTLRTDGQRLLASGATQRIDAALRKEIEDSRLQLVDLLLRIRATSDADAGGTRAPLTPSQRAIYVHSVLEKDSTAYHMPLVLRVRGALRVSVLRESLNELVRRHPTLRSRYFSAEGGKEFYQEVIDGAGVVLETADGSDWEDAARTALAQPFDLELGETFRARFLRAEENLGYLICVAHHISADGWSGEILKHDLAAIYRARVFREQAAPEPRVRFVDWAHQYSRRISTTRDTARAFWKVHLRGLEGRRLMRVLPCEGSGSSTYRYVVERPHWASAADYAKANGCSSFHVLLAAVASAICTLCDQRDTLIVCPRAVRDRMEVASAVGLFLENVLVRVPVQASNDFSALCRTVAAEFRRSSEYSSLSLGEIAVAAGERPGSAFNAVQQVSVNFQDWPEREPDFGDVEVDALEVENLDAKYAVTVYAKERDGALVLAYHAANDRFGPEAIDALHRFVRQTIRRVAGAALGNETSEQLGTSHDDGVARRVQFRETHDSIAVCFRRAAETNRDRDAVVFGSGKWTYSQLLERVDGARAVIDARRPGRDTCIAILASRNEWLPVALLACLHTDLAYSVITPNDAAHRVSAALTDLPISLFLLTDESLLPWAAARGIDVSRCVVLSDRSLRPVESPDYVPGDPNAVACLTLTSGTTHEPRAVRGRQGGLSFHLSHLQSRFGFGSADRFALLAGLSTDPLQRDVLVPLAIGAAVLIPEEEVIRSSQLSSWIGRSGVTVVNLTPGLGRFFSSSLEGERVPQAPALRWIFYCGDVLRWKDVVAARQIAPNAGVVNLYGLTETQRALTEFVCVAPGKPLSEPRTEFVPLSGTGPDTTAVVVRPDLTPVNDYELGEILLSSAHLSDGYHRSPVETALKFIPDERGLRRVRTGDLGRGLPDGTIEFLGRADRQVNIRGFRFSLFEVEAAASRIPGVRQCHAHVAEGGDRAPILILHWTSSLQALSSLELRAQLQAVLSPMMLPSRIIRVESFPMTGGKIDWRALPLEEPRDAGPTAALHDDKTIALVEIWKEQLHVGDVGLDDDFFALGGDSLIAIGLCEKVSRYVGRPYGLAELFARPTLRACVAFASERERKQTQATQPADESTIGPIVRGDYRDRPFGLTDLQHSYLVGRATNVGLWGATSSGAYAELEVFSIAAERIVGAVRTMIEIHPSLRCVFDGDRQRELPEDACRYELPTEDCRSLSDDETARVLARIRASMEAREFVPAEWPLFDLRLTRVTDERSVLHVAVDMLVMDYFSGLILLRELIKLSTDDAPEMARPGLHFGDYVAYLQTRKALPGYAAARDYWMSRLAELPGGPELPRVESGDLHPARYSRRSFEIAAQDWEGFAAAAADLSISRAALLATIFAETLALWAVGRHFCLNLPFFDRPPEEPGFRDVVGDFTSTILLECDLRGGDFSEHAKRIQGQLTRDLAHAQFSGVSVLRESGRFGGSSRGLIAPVVFTYTLDHLSEWSRGLAADDGAVRCIYQKTRTPQVLLDHGTARSDTGVTLSWTTLDGAYSEEVLEDMFGAYEAAVRRVSAEGGRLESSTLVQLPVEQREARRRLNDTRADAPPQLLHTGFLDSCERFPERIAVESSDRRISYRELRRLATVVEEQLLASEVKRGDVVAVALPKGWMQIPAVLGVLLAGASYLPLDPSQPIARIERILKTARPACVLSDSENASKLSGFRNVIVDSIEGSTPATRERSLVTASVDDPAYVIFTSGSTGEPKGVVIPHRAATNTVSAVNSLFDVGSHDAVLALSSLSFDLSVWDIFGLLGAGGRIVVPNVSQLSNPSCWIDLVQKHGVTIWNSVPALMSLFWENVKLRGIDRPQGLRLVLLSGDWIQPSLARDLMKEDPPVRTVSLGGATEASIWSIFHQITSLPDGARSVPYGTPLPNQSIHVLDAEFGERPDFAVGEIFIGGAGLAREYLGDAKRTKASFVIHPRTGERLYRTGDLGRFTEHGCVELLGRLDTQIKLAGHRIELGEIDAALQKLRTVREAVTVMQQDDRGSSYLAACLVPAEGSGLQGQKVRVLGEEESKAYRQELEAALPSYMIPSLFVLLQQLPLSANGKVDRRNLSASVRRSRPAAARATDGVFTATEKRVEAVWCELLGVDGVPGRTATFFELGGDSLLAMRCLSRVNREFGVDIDIGQLYRLRTLGEFAGLVDQQALVRVVSSGDGRGRDVSMESGVL